ncbi:MAG: hypothetical protein IPK26_15045 [Planctomycetes bacterium]|nr:hypothetical protein [Planctomycetota bacterium]
MPPRRTRLQKCLELLVEHQGPLTGGPPRDPWAAILWENVVYLTDEQRRDEAFLALERATSLRPDRLLEATDDALLGICGKGKMAASQVQKLRDCARLFLEIGDPRTLVTLPESRAMTALQEFPGIGRPGAERLLLFAGHGTALALESNGLRTLQRLGYGDDLGDYGKSYRATQGAAAEELDADGKARIDAYLRLRRHGQQQCRKKPVCDSCPLQKHCDARRGDGMNH